MLVLLLTKQTPPLEISRPRLFFYLKHYYSHHQDASKSVSRERNPTQVVLHQQSIVAKPRTPQDVMCPAVQLDHRVALKSMDETIGQDMEQDQDITLHDCLAGHGESADQVAARHLDWPMVAERLNCRESYVVQGTALETPGIKMARRLRVSTPRITQIKREVSRKIREAWGEDALQDAVREPVWHSQMRAHSERRACRAERRVA